MRTLLILALLVAAGGGLRGALVLETDYSNLLRADAYEYYRYALNLKLCGVYSPSLESILTECKEPPVADNLRPPGFPLMILPFVEWPPTPAMMRKIQWLQVVLGSLSIALAFAAFRRLGPIVGLGSAALVALSPHLVATSLNFLTENLFTFTILLFVYCSSRWFQKPSLISSLLVGVTLALPLLVRPTTLYLLIFALPFFFVAAKQSRLRTLSALLGGFLLCFGPWYALSTFVLPDRDVPSLALMTIHTGTYIDLTVPGDPQSRGAPHNFDPTFASRDSLGKVIAHLKDRASAAPAEYLQWYLFGKPVMYLSWDVVAGFGDIFIYPVRYHGYQSNYWLHLSREFMWYLHWPLTLLGLVGCALAWTPWLARRGIDPIAIGTARLMSLVVLYFLAVHMAGMPLPRYAIPIKPLLFAFACWVLALCPALYRNPRSTRG